MNASEFGDDNHTPHDAQPTNTAHPTHRRLQCRVEDVLAAAVVLVLVLPVVLPRHNSLLPPPSSSLPKECLPHTPHTPTHTPPTHSHHGRCGRCPRGHGSPALHRGGRHPNAP